MTVCSLADAGSIPPPRADDNWIETMVSSGTAVAPSAGRQRVILIGGTTTFTGWISRVSA
jgi:hypothetical protein